MSDFLIRAKNYCQSRNIQVDEKKQLGYGTDGGVWRTSSNNAVKVFERLYNYDDELECYRRFEAQGIRDIKGFAVPQLVDHDDELMIIEMSIVEPPYLLDFGKVYLDIPPRYFEDKDFMQQWFEEYKEFFDDDWPIVRKLLNALEEYGIYYVAPKMSEYSLSVLRESRFTS